MWAALLRHRRNIARGTMKVGTILGGDDLEAIWNDVNGRYGAVTLRQTGHTRLATLGASQFFVPLVNIARNGKTVWLVCRFGSGPNSG